jgi:hypothetical protein
MTTDTPGATLAAVTLAGAIGLYLLLTAAGVPERFIWVACGIWAGAGGLFMLADYRANRKP